MNFTILKRTCASLATGALCALTLAPVPAQAAISPAATGAGAWLAGELTGGLIHNDQYDFDDYGLTLDVLLGLQETKAQGSAQGDIVAAMETNIKSYVFNSPNKSADDGVWAGSAAKAMVAAQGAHKEPKSFGGVDLVDITESTVVESGSDKGRLTDEGIAGYPDPSVPADYSNLLYQAFGLQGLAEARSDKVGSVRDFLLKQQCGAGYFRLYYTECKPDVDATAIAIRAMTAAQADGVAGMDAALAEATTWLLAQQDADGSFGGGESTADANSNSTGLAASALAFRGQTAAAREAAAWVFQWQVAESTGAKLKGDEGAIGLNSDAVTTAKAHGIDPLAEDQWRRATAQAILGLIHLDPATIRTGTKTVTKTQTKTVIKAAKPIVRTKVVKGGNSANVAVTEGEKIDAEAASAQGKLGQFLASKLSNGDHIEVKDGKKKFTDYDLTADTALALRLLGEQPKLAERVTAFLFDKKSIDAFAHGAPYEKKAVYAEPVAKLIIAGTLAKKSDERRLSALGGDLAALQDDRGAFVDDGRYADESNGTERHVLAVLAAQMSGEQAAADKAVRYLETMQCADGGFASELVQGCKTGDPAATGWALQALNAVDADSVDDQALLSAAPQGWPDNRSDRLQAAAMSLQKSLRADGAVTHDADAPDLVATAAVASGREAVGLTDAGASTLLAAAQVKDGGLPKGPNDKRGDLAVSAASATGVAQTSWLSTSHTGLAHAISLPLASGQVAAGPHEGGVSSQAYAISPRVMYAGLAALTLLVLAGLGFGASRLRRKPGAPV